MYSGGFCLPGERLSGPDGGQMKTKLFLIPVRDEQQWIEIPWNEMEQCYVIPEIGELVFRMEYGSGAMK